MAWLNWLGKDDAVRRRKQQALNLAGIYGAFLLVTLVFRPHAALLGLSHVVFAGWFGYLYIGRQGLGFLLYGIASALILIGLVTDGAYFGVTVLRDPKGPSGQEGTCRVSLQCPRFSLLQSLKPRPSVGCTHHSVRVHQGSRRRNIGP